MSKRLPAFLKSLEVVALLTAAQTAVAQAQTPSKRFAASRDLSMIVTMLVTGLRIAEACALEIGELDLAEGMLKVSHGKGDKQRMVPIPERIMQDLRAWIGARNGFVWPTCGRRWMNPRTFQRRLAKLAKAAGLGSECHPHTLRHCYATSLLRAGCDIKELQVLLGHANIATTAKYLHAEVSRLKSVVNKL